MCEALATALEQSEEANTPKATTAEGNTDGAGEEQVCVRACVLVVMCVCV